MKCTDKEITIPTDDRCNEMIDSFDEQISAKFNTKHKFSKKERKLLIQTINENPNDFWIVGEYSLIHYELKL